MATGDGVALIFGQVYRHYRFAFNRKILPTTVSTRARGKLPHSYVYVPSDIVSGLNDPARIGDRFRPRMDAVVLQLIIRLSLLSGLAGGLHGALDQRQIYRICYALLVVTALKLLWDGTSGFLA